MSKNFLCRFSGTVKIANKDIDLRFGKVGRQESFFVVTNYRESLGMVLQPEKKNADRYHIRLRNFTIGEEAKKELEDQLNQIISSNDLDIPDGEVCTFESCPEELPEEAEVVHAR